MVSKTRVYRTGGVFEACLGVINDLVDTKGTYAIDIRRGGGSDYVRASPMG
jgi:hypothetical protein